MNKPVLPKEKERALFLALFRVILDWPDCRSRPVSWAELAEKLPEAQRYSHDILRYYVVRSAGLDYLQLTFGDQDSFQVSRLTRHGKRAVRSELNPYRGLERMGLVAYATMVILMVFTMIYVWWIKR